MSVEQIFQTLDHEQKIQVVDLTLPGIEFFLKDVLSKENLSAEGEILRCRYLSILQNRATTNHEEDPIDISESSPLKTPQIKGTPFDFDNDDKGYIDGRRKSHASQDEEKPPARSRTSRKGTDSTEESGVFFGTQYLPSVGSEGHEASNHRHSDTFESTSSRETFMSDSEVEFLEWDADLLEDGYSTGDNMDMVSPNMNIQPNELGELYAGVLYIREQPGWHKRWFVLTETCLKCYKFKTDEKMLFEIPLRDARFVSTDRKRSRMYAITLSIARLKDDITFATTDEKSRQEWVYVINHVIKTLTLEETRDSNADLSGNRTNQIEASSEELNSNKLNFEDSSIKRNTWHCGSDTAAMKILHQFALNGDEESSDLEKTMTPSLAQEESLKELQQCLPDILQRPKSKSWKGDLSKAGDVQDGASARKTITFSQDVDNFGNCDSSNVPRVKRHGSLANSLANKAARVRSKLTTTSFFKKGKKDDKISQEITSQSTTFSGYLARKKAGTWKNRWCVVKDRTFFCYKDFGANLPELELTLEGCVVETLPDREGEKPYCFILVADNEQLQFAAENDADLEEWMEVLDREVRVTEEHVDDCIEIYPLDETAKPTITSQEPQQTVQATQANAVEKEPKKSSKSAKDKDQVIDATAVEKEVKKSSKSGKSKEQATDVNVVEKELKKPSKSSKDKDKNTKDSGKRSKFLGTLANKLGKHPSKTRETQGHKIDELRKQIDELDIDSLQSEDTTDEVGPYKDGIMYRQYGNKYIECKVKLQNHKLEIEPQELSVDESMEPSKFRLINCIVLDCTDTEGPLVMVIKRNIGEPLYLRAQSEEEYSAWKSAIVAASLTTSSSIERLLSNDSNSSNHEDYQKNIVSASTKASDDVFHSDSAPELKSSLTAMDVPCHKLDNKISHIRRAYSAGGIDRLRSHHQGYLVYSKRKQSPLRRTISNVINSLDLAPKNRRSKTFAGLGINAALLVGIKYSSTVFLRVNKELWVPRWCVVQNNNLHFFIHADDLTPKSSISLSGSVVEQVNVKGKCFAFKLYVPSGKVDFYFAVNTEQERKAWMEVLQAEGEQAKEDVKSNLDLHNGVLLSRVKSDSNIAPAISSGKNPEENKKTLRGMSQSLTELRKISQQSKGSPISDRNGNSIKSSTVLTQRPTSLQEVLQLLQEQQMMQSMGHQRYIRVKKARGNWKKSAAAVLKDSHSNPESPEAPRKPSIKPEEIREKSEPESQRKPRGTSTGSSHSTEQNEATSKYEPSDEYLDKKAEEEELKALKTETLLRKRRNSLNLEKEVLEKKLGKTQEKKSGVKKLLGKEVPKDSEEILKAKKRLGELNLKLANVDHDMQENRTKKAAAMENITVLKAKNLRKASGTGEMIGEFTPRPLSDERRAKFRDSPTGSTSSRESFEEKPDTSKRTERSSSLHRKGSKNKASQASLMALEEELLKISPYPSRKSPHRIVKRVSSSSEGSIEDFSVRKSPATHRRSMSDAKADSALSQSHDKLFGWDTVEMKKKRHSVSSPQTMAKSQLKSVAVSIPTDSGNDENYGSAASSLSSLNSEHRPSLITALSQIKDFEEFLEINRRR